MRLKPIWGELDGNGDENTELGYWVVDNGYLEVPEELESYLDYEGIGRDFGYDLVVVEDKIFSNY